MSTKYLGADLRHPRRRSGPGLPASRERAGPVARGRRRIRAVLDAQRPGQHPRREDEQVARQLPAGGRAWYQPVRPVELRYYLGQAHYRSGIDYTAGRAGRGGDRVPPDRGLRDQGASERLPAEGRRPAARCPAAFVGRDGRRSRRAAGAGGPARISAGGQQRDRRRRRGGHSQAAWPRPGPCWPCSGLIRWPSRGRPGRAGRACGRWWTCWCGSRWTSGRRAERRDYTAADAIRDDLLEAGIVVEDTPRGPRWELRRERLGPTVGRRAARVRRGGADEIRQAQAGHRRLRQAQARRQGPDAARGAAAGASGPAPGRRAGEEGRPAAGR